MNYFEDVINGFIPINKPLILQRIIMNGIPAVSSEEDSDQGAKSDEENLGQTAQNKEDALVCAPYFQLFKNGKIIHSSLNNQKTPDKYYT
mmetsp:Transcript_33698/g.32722  ORF Transcript_33698/g.32722 Transcript_33698/m.32722 type:complete len:90 (-) Transcript_33698:898-1167(-)